MPEEILEAMVEDAFFVSHPLSVKEAEVRTPQEILSLFDGITYSKVNLMLLNGLKIGHYCKSTN